MKKTQIGNLYQIFLKIKMMYIRIETYLKIKIKDILKTTIKWVKVINDLTLLINIIRYQQKIILLELVMINLFTKLKKMI
jgi:hypothetical protein